MLGCICSGVALVVLHELCRLVEYVLRDNSRDGVLYADYLVIRLSGMAVFLSGTLVEYIHTHVLLIMENVIQRVLAEFSLFLRGISQFVQLMAYITIAVAADVHIEYQPDSLCFFLVYFQRSGGEFYIIAQGSNAAVVLGSLGVHHLSLD